MAFLLNFEWQIGILEVCRPNGSIFDHILHILQGLMHSMVKNSSVRPADLQNTIFSLKIWQESHLRSLEGWKIISKLTDFKIHFNFPPINLKNRDILKRCRWIFWWHLFSGPEIIQDHWKSDHSIVNFFVP